MIARARRGAMFLTFPVAGLTYVAVLSGCASSGPSDPVDRAATRLTAEQVQELPVALKCDRSEILEGDLGFFDPMTGMNCYFADGTSILVRAYEHGSSVAHVLVGLDGTFGPSNEYVRGSNWYGAGTPDRLVALLREVGLDLPLRVAVDTNVPALDEVDEQVGTCMSFLAGLIRGKVEGTSAGGDYSSMGVVYPGGSVLVEEVAQAVGPVASANADVAISKHTDRLRAYCRELEESRVE